MHRYFCWKKKIWVAFANHIFFSKNISVYAIFNDQNFNNTLPNDIVSFEQLGPGMQTQNHRYCFLPKIVKYLPSVPNQNPIKLCIVSYLPMKYTVSPQRLEHGWLVYRGWFELFFQSLQNSSNSSRKQIFNDFFLYCHGIVCCVHSFNDSNIDGSLTMADSNLFFTP